ncbi:non-specific serine/threonine protein kinase [Entamoeba marina]
MKKLNAYIKLNSHDWLSDGETRSLHTSSESVCELPKKNGYFHSRLMSGFSPKNEVAHDPGLKADIERYGLIYHQIIGSGATGSVCYCTNSNNVEFAVKVIETAKIIDCRFALIAKELNIMKELQHPNIIKFHDVWITPSRLIIAMELAYGDTLFDYILDNGCLKSEYVCLIIHKMLSALEYLHSLHIAHRDIKLENIMFATFPNDFNNIRLIDFGFARKVDIDGLPSPSDVGSLAYRSPEMITPGKHGTKVDIWALGVVTYILLSGIPPFKSRDKDPTYFQPFWLLVNEDNFQLTTEIQQGVLHIEKEFVEVDDKAIEFIKNTLVVNEEERLSAKECLELEWFKMCD